MCTKDIQTESKKRRDIEQRLRPLAAAHFAYSRNPTGKGLPDGHPLPLRSVLDEVRSLIEDLGIRECCYTMPTERHTEVCRG
jgi:hypothetical protein